MLSENYYAESGAAMRFGQQPQGPGARRASTPR